MANAKISALPAVTTPASTDEFAVNQGGTTKKETRAQLHTLESGEHLILPQVDEAATPTLRIGDIAGFYSPSSSQINIVTNALHWRLFSDVIRGDNVAGPQLTNQGASATAATIVPNAADVNTGLGWRADDVGVLIGGGINCVEYANVGSAAAVGFYGTAAIVKQTGVAQTAAALQTALVNLGLITAA